MFVGIEPGFRIFGYFCSCGCFLGPRISLKSRACTPTPTPTHYTDPLKFWPLCHLLSEVMGSRTELIFEEQIVAHCVPNLHVVVGDLWSSVIVYLVSLVLKKKRQLLGSAFVTALRITAASAWPLLQPERDQESDGSPTSWSPSVHMPYMRVQSQ